VAKAVFGVLTHAIGSKKSAVHVLEKIAVASSQTAESFGS
jgi:hypothetical protein